MKSYDDLKAEMGAIQQQMIESGTSERAWCEERCTVFFNPRLKNDGCV